MEYSWFLTFFGRFCSLTLGITCSLWFGWWFCGVWFWWQSFYSFGYPDPLDISCFLICCGSPSPDIWTFPFICWIEPLLLELVQDLQGEILNRLLEPYSQPSNTVCPAVFHAVCVHFSCHTAVCLQKWPCLPEKPLGHPADCEYRFLDKENHPSIPEGWFFQDKSNFLKSVWGERQEPFSHKYQTAWSDAG